MPFINFSPIQNFYPPQPILDFLKKSLFGFGIFDSWSIIHFISGMIVFLLFSLLVKKNNLRFLYVFVALISFELFELVLLKQDLIVGENTFNIILDVIVGLLGAFVVSKFSKRKKRKRRN